MSIALLNRKQDRFTSLAIVTLVDAFVTPWIVQMCELHMPYR